MIASMFRRLLGQRSGGDVIRLHTVKTLHTHTVAEHTFGAMLIAQELCAALGINSTNVLRALLYHDIDEVATGDIPAPVKWRCPEINDILFKIGDSFLDMHGVPDIELSEFEKRLVKAADYGDLAFRCLKEMELGNRTRAIGEVFDNCLHTLSELHVEQVDYLVTELNKERMNVCER